MLDYKGDSRRFKEAIYEQFARIGKAVASPRRLELLDSLCQGDKTVEDLAEHAHIDIKSASAHLKVLKSARLVESRRFGKFVRYRLADETVGGFWLALRTLARERLSEIDRAVASFVSDLGEAAPLDRRALLSGARRGDIVVLDVRPADEFAAGHLPHA